MLHRFIRSWLLSAAHLLELDIEASKGIRSAAATARVCRHRCRQHGIAIRPCRPIAAHSDDVP
jgi:hypothetical protein